MNALPPISLLALLAACGGQGSDVAPYSATLVGTGGDSAKAPAQSFDSSDFPSEQVECHYPVPCVGADEGPTLSVYAVSGGGYASSPSFAVLVPLPTAPSVTTESSDGSTPSAFSAWFTFDGAHQYTFPLSGQPALDVPATCTTSVTALSLSRVAGTLVCTGLPGFDPESQVEGSTRADVKVTFDCPLAPMCEG
jgi:hypothetical protein